MQIFQNVQYLDNGDSPFAVISNEPSDARWNYHPRLIWLQVFKGILYPFLEGDIKDLHKWLTNCLVET